MDYGYEMNATTSTISVVLAGVGGQGILLASEITARAAMAAGYQVKTNEVHGMAQRGGSVIAQIRYGAEVHSPLVAIGSARVLGSFEEMEAVRNAHYLAPDGLAVVSKQRLIPVTVSSGAATYPEDIEKRLGAVFPRLRLLDTMALAREAGDPRAVNVIVLGALSLGLDLPEEAWRQAIHASIAEKFRAMNQKAFEIGRRSAQ